MKGLLVALFSILLAASSASAQEIWLKEGEELAVVRRSTKSSQARALALENEFKVAKATRAAMALGFSKDEVQSLRKRSIKKVAASPYVGACQKIMAKNPDLLCEPNRVLHLKALASDSYYDQLWGMTSIHAAQAWDYGVGSSAVKVAVVDTGVSLAHPDLSSNIARNSGEIPNNWIDDDGNGFVDDYQGYDFVDSDSDPTDENGHGTHVSGTIGAVGNNGIGVSGVSWSVGIIPVRVLDSFGTGTLVDVASGIDYAVSRGADVINLSIGSDSSSAILQSAVQSAGDAGALVVVAAGNESSNNDVIPSYPANYRLAHVISVASIDASERLSSFSNYGPSTVDIAAPGDDILSTTIDGDYGYMSGTSMATPHVAGAAALIKSLNPSLRAPDLRYLLLAHARPLPLLTGLVSTGATLDVLQAMASSLGLTPTVPGIRLRQSRLDSRAATLVGQIYDSQSLAALPARSVSLLCNGRIQKRATSNAQGTLRFGTVRRSKKNRNCVATDGLVSSRALKVKKL